MAYQHIETTIDGAIAAVWINRPQVRNALSFAVLDELKDCFTGLAANEDLIAVTLSGRGERCFAAGGDLHEISAYKSADAAARISLTARNALDAVRDCPVPVYALLNGDAIGGGAELALACDVRLASNHARIGYAQASLNLSPAWGGAADLIRTLGAARALELMASARLVAAAEAFTLGLVDGVSAAGQAFAAYCDDYFATIRARRPQVMRALKAITIAHRGTATVDPRTVELDAMRRTWCHEDHWSAHAAVLERIRAKKNGAEAAARQ